ncbi:tRNA-dihydrouridine(47) synthase [NAD(P)(+)]-like [Ctenocephalides felis]|uniref:tRNA-dihydrouridine(47) synthase [NAD(P)(+)]-like n=1 Tax=Ctenocephalides felis TaxID=7515 RepID=UPI000E6E50F6|nr:tRNA-dihydrouridine(47) synthase [NAD(P)(+)]-like [Ctenocephalides felis]
MSAGICAIKEEFIVKNDISNPSETATKDDNVDETSKQDLSQDDAGETPNKKIKLSKREKKRNRGQNKSRPAPYKVTVDDKLCRELIDVLENETRNCTYKNCKCQHDVLSYLQNKPKDIGDFCYIYKLRGRCPAGLSCRFGREHISESGYNMVSENYDPNKSKSTLNQLGFELQTKLRKKTYDFKKTEISVKKVEKFMNAKKDLKQNGSSEPNVLSETTNITESAEARLGCVTDEDIISTRKCEKKKIDWSNKLFLSPLTTVGNLPFRRICKEFGADVTCGEMALSIPIIQGANQEWALAKRHESEDLFGVQICGYKAHLVGQAVQVLQENCAIDFVDINLGCPIELIYQNGAGSALLRRPNILEGMIRTCVDMMDMPLTVKTRTGVYADKNVAHDYFPKFKEWGVSCATIHGRSREQRYTRTADWEYIEKCAASVENQMPVIGNGDILSFQDYLEAKRVAPHISGVMLGRGALVKPWLFTEIKEQKAIDISSKERFEILKKYVNYGLEHWGSDTKGVENTRRFLLEWQSFLYRYVPLGLLERPPQKINERPPVYRGRDDLETMMASNNCKEWIKLSEMLLGPVPDGFTFLPKHKANSYS